MAVAVYLALSLFDHAARADAGSIDQIGATDPVASGKAAGARKVIPKPKSIIPKSTALRVLPHRIHRPAIKTPKVRPPKIQKPKTAHALQNQASERVSAPSIRDGGTVRTSELRQPTSDAARDAARATVTPAGMAVIRQKVSTPTQISSLPKLADLAQAAFASWPRPPDPPQLQLPALPQLPSWPQLTNLPQAHLPALPQQPGPPQAWAPAPARTTASLNALVPHQPLMPAASAPTPGLSGVTKPPTARAQPRTAPLPAPSRQPPDRSTSTGQARDSGSGNAPVMGTVSSSWRAEVVATGCRLATDLIARGRTVRYAGPPS
ncbi:hypothetical protein ACFQFC_20925 [Amorphoplanes digitatis]|uniref:Uncharacterized protein n=1 Tax=Actinoplanes digitatis TaxID=1868 RepID=A0A7W7I5B2_9ACTN|nr:hypothetical protein [Actinoplanes digitatis]MBB4766682.1 hypothetical protein [Actinoplanes digitatis]